MKVTKDSRYLCLYMILGDGCLLKEGRFKIAHCEKQLDQGRDTSMSSHTSDTEQIELPEGTVPDVLFRDLALAP